MKRILSLFILLIAVCSFGPSVNDIVSKRLNQANSTLTQLEKYTMEMEYNVYSGESKIPMEKSLSTISKNGKFGYYQQMTGYLILQDQQVRLTIDDTNKVILLTAPQLQNKNQSIDLESAMKMATEMKLLQDDADKSSIQFLFTGKNQFDFTSIKVDIDNTEKIISGITIRYKPKNVFSPDGNSALPGRLEIKTRSFKKGVTADARLFNVGSYVKKGPAGWILQGKYKHYQLIDQTQK